MGWAGKGIYKPLKQLASRGEIIAKPNSKKRKGMVYSFPCTDDGKVNQLCNTPPLNIEYQQEEDSQIHIEQGLEDSHLLVISESSVGHPPITSKNLDTPQTVTGPDSHLVTFKDEVLGGVCLDNQPTIEFVPETTTEEITIANDSNSNPETNPAIASTENIKPASLAHWGENLVFVHTIDTDGDRAHVALTNGSEMWLRLFELTELKNFTNG